MRHYRFYHSYFIVFCESNNIIIIRSKGGGREWGTGTGKGRLVSARVGGAAHSRPKDFVEADGIQSTKIYSILRHA